MPAIVDYCRGMGLIRLFDEGRDTIRRPRLTPFGRAVLSSDRFLKEPLTQWIAHFHLCSAISGAEVWYQTFVGSAAYLGNEFRREALENHLAAVLSSKARGLIGPLIRMYEDDASFSTCGALAEADGLIRRRAAPVDNKMAGGYGAWIVQLIGDHFPDSQQVSAAELESRAAWRTISGWGISESPRVLELVERKGVVQVDRHMNPWLIQMKVSADSAWASMYDVMI
ncbi:MAG: DUF4007 family protein [Candidatus Sumerlaeota bacterium]|nr:DUF4007 family protein [Candidatus Sumerlaeota bacterium]